jgi:NADH:ubiquinone oxidoreductase subunit K
MFFESINWNNLINIDFLIFFDFIQIFYFGFLGFLIILVGIYGLIFKKFTLLHLLLYFEIILLGFNLVIFMFIIYYFNFQGIFILFILLMLAAVESAIGFSLLILSYRLTKNLLILNFNKLRF